MLDRLFVHRKLLTARLRNGGTMEVPVPDTIGSLLFWLGEYEPTESRVFTAMLRQGVNVLDVGANLGYYTILAGLRIGKEGRVFAFEPIRENFDVLLRNVARNHLTNVTCYQCALGSESCTIDLYRYHSQVNCGLASVIQTAEAPEALRETVNQERVDEKIGNAQVDLVKIDVQGAECRVLAGMRNVISTHKPTILWELNPDSIRRLGDSIACTIDMLEGNGYRTLIRGPSGWETADLTELESMRNGVSLLSVAKFDEIAILPDDLRVQW